MANLFQKLFTTSVYIAVQLILLSASMQVLAAGIEFTNGRVSSLSTLLFLSPEQQKEADTRHSVSLTPEQSVYLSVASRLDRTRIANLNVLSIEEAKKADTNQLLNVGVRLTYEALDVPIDFLGTDAAERDRLSAEKLYSESASSSRDEAVVEDRKALWSDFRLRITSWLCDYYAKYPNRFRYIGSDDEVEVSGFGTFVAKEQIFDPSTGGWQVHDGIIYDPWGEPLHFIKHRGESNKIKARGFESIVMRTWVINPAECVNEKELLGVCKYSSKGFEDAPWNCIYSDVRYEEPSFREKRLKKEAAMTNSATSKP
jgi:hypothetical protein